MKKFGKRTIALAVAAVAALAVVSAALATVSFDSATGQGFIGRGDVIDHPNLGKQALVDNPTITFGATGFYQQYCLRTPPPGASQNPRYFVTGDQTVAFAVQRETRKAPGNGNITGYLLQGVGAPAEDPPERVCPAAASGWEPYDDITTEDVDESQVTFVATSGGVLTFTTGNLSGAWQYDANTDSWVAIS